MLLSIHYMVKHVETLWVTMSNGLWNEIHLNPVTKCHYPQARIPNLCLASGKGRAVNLSHGMLRLSMVSVILCHFAAMPSLPPATPTGLNISPKNSLWGWWQLLHVLRRKCAVLLERVIPVWCSLAILKHRRWWSHPHLWGRSEGRGNMPWREFCTHIENHKNTVENPV